MYVIVDERGRYYNSFESYRMALEALSMLKRRYPKKQFEIEEQD